MKTPTHTQAPAGKTLRWEVVRLIYAWRLIHTDGDTVYDEW